MTVHPAWEVFCCAYKTAEWACTHSVCIVAWIGQIVYEWAAAQHLEDGMVQVLRGYERDCMGERLWIK